MFYIVIECLETQIQRDENGYKVVQRFIDEINAKIDAVNLRVKLSLCEATNQKVYVLHTINENDVTK
jgi:RNA:NAD 2'-phosphotransferase (TPT1/KptA family)